MTNEFITHSVEETEQKAAELATQMRKGMVIGFIGDLGAGKTAFTRGFVKGLGIDAEVSSPTFAICNEYSGNGLRVLHYDMYRVDNWDDLFSVGFVEALDSGAYIICEWSENIFGALPFDAVVIQIERLSENERKFTISKKADHVQR